MERILRKKQAVAISGLPYSTLNRYEKAGKFPKRVSLGGACVGWVESEIQAWVQEKMAQRDRAAE